MRQRSPLGGILLAAALLGLAFWLGQRHGERAQAPAPAIGAPQGHAPAPTPLPDAGAASDAASAPRDLPAEATATLRRIAAGGPYAHRQDGGVFGNRERRLPLRERGWYREYTVETPGARDRGARRIVTGGSPPVEFWYTDDHYRSFRRYDWPAR